MVASEIRAKARESLTGKWGKAAVMVLCYSIINFVMAFVLNLIIGIGPIIYIIVTPVLAYGFLASLIKLKRGEEVNYVDFFNLGFSSFGKIWGVIGNILLKLLIPVILLIVFVILLSIGFTGAIITTLSHSMAASSSPAFLTLIGIVGFIGYIVTVIYLVVKGYLYALSYFVLFDHPEMNGKQIVEKSAELMNQNRWKLFWLILSFIGWAFLCAFTFGIGYLWLFPYIAFATIIFYENRLGNDDSSTTEVITETITPVKEESNDEENDEENDDNNPIQ